MFRRVDDFTPKKGGHLIFEGSLIPFRLGDSVAAALLAAGFPSFRDHPITGEARGPHCMMGHCFECLIIIDGQQNRQSCLTLAVNGMVVERQRGVRHLA